MTREEVKKIIGKIWDFGYPWKHELNYLNTHDAEQWHRIEVLEQALVEKDREYQQLMVKAVRFAEFTWILGPTGKEAEEFLSSLKTKAFLKEHQ